MSTLSLELSPDEVLANLQARARANAGDNRAEAIARRETALPPVIVEHPGGVATVTAEPEPKRGREEAPTATASDYAALIAQHRPMIDEAFAEVLPFGRVELSAGGLGGGTYYDLNLSIRGAYHVLSQVDPAANPKLCKAAAVTIADVAAHLVELDRMTLRVYLAGYGNNHTTKQLFDAAKAVTGQILDIRHVPHSKREEWQQEPLRALFRGRYQHVPQLGNRNYKGEFGDGIIIVNMEAGIREVLRVLEQERRSPILLCGCGEEEGCHRCVIGNVLRSGGKEVRSLPW